MNGVDFKINLIDNFSQTLTKVDNKFKETFKNMSDRVKGLSNQFSGINTALAGVGVVAFTKKIIDATTNIEKMQIKLASVFDTPNREGFGAMLYEEIRKVQESSELSRGAFVDLALQMKFVEDRGEKLGEVLSQISDISRGNEGSFSALGDVLIKLGNGYAYNEKMQRQLISIGFNPLKEISKETGESMASLTQKLKEGTLGYNQIRQAMSRATSEGGDFANLSEKIANTFGERLNSQIARLPDIMAKMGGTLTSRLEPILAMFEKFSDKIMDGKINLTLFTNVLSNFTVVGLGAVAVMKVFNFLAQMNPFVRIATGVILLGSYLAEVVNWGLRFKEIFESFGNGKIAQGFVAIGKLILEVITKPILALVEMLTSIIPDALGGSFINQKVKDFRSQVNNFFGDVPIAEEPQAKTRADFSFNPQAQIGGSLLKDLEDFNMDNGKNKITGGNITTFNLSIQNLTGLVVEKMNGSDINESQIGDAIANVLVRELAQLKGV